MVTNLENFIHDCSLRMKIL